MTVNIDWDSLSFSLTPTRTMFIAKSDKDGNWNEGEFVPFGNVSLSPAAGVLNYGQGLFEGLKAYRTKDGRILMFRPIENIKRLNNGAERICMPQFDENKFVEIVKKLVLENEEFIPPFGKGSLYLRPCLWGTGGLLGVGPANEYTLLIFTSPVGPYFKTGMKPIKLQITTDYHRAAPKGTGGVKYIGNYAGGMLAGKIAKQKGFNEAIFLDAKEDKYIEEVGAANFFCIKGNKLLTPKLGSILPGITRDSIMKLAKDVFKMDIVEKNVSVEEALDCDEVFCSGTGAVISSIGSISYKDKEYTFNNFEVGQITLKLYDLLTHIQTGEEKESYGWVIEVK